MSSMKVLLTSFGSTGDVQPMLALAQRLQKSHDAVLAVSPHFLPWTRQLGVNAVAVGPEIPAQRRLEVTRALVRQPTPADQLRGLFDAMLPALPQLHDDLDRLAADRDVLVFSPTQPAAAIVRERRQLMGIMVLNGTIARRMSAPVRSVIRDAVNRIRSAYDLVPQHDPLGEMFDSCALVLYALSTAWFPRPPGWPDKYRVSGFVFLDEPESPLPSELEPFVNDAGAPLVFVTFGSMTHEESAGGWQAVYDAIATLPCRAIVQGDAGARPLPPNARRLTSYVPYAQILKGTACVVHHGGIGTTAATLRAGTPSVVIPHLLDQFVWADMLHASGCAPAPVPALAQTADRLRDGIGAVLSNSSYRDTAQRFAARIATENGAATATQLIERLHV